MGILIKGMEMPKSCSSCDFTHICIAIKKLERKNASQKKMYEAFVGRLADCPLVALPEHGRLCDLDALIEHETYNIEQALFDADEVLEDLKNVPVIVEASNGTDN